MLTITSCGNTSELHPFVGDWRSTINDGGKNVTVGLKLSFRANKYQGSFSILSKTGKGADIDKGFVIALVNIRQAGNFISFIAPIKKGVIDGDSILFNLKAQGHQLTGTLKENRTYSRVLPIIFSK